MDERDTTCCYARQDKFWVQGAPNGERWEIYTVLADSPTFWGQDGGQSWAAAEAALDAGPDRSGADRAVLRRPRPAERISRFPGRDVLLAAAPLPGIHPQGVTP